MTIENSSNTYAKLLKEQGNYVITMEGIDWFDYSGFMTPAYLPHCVPEISKDTAQKVLKKARTPFVRWDCDFDKINESQWWYVLKRGKWDISEIRNKKKRWAVRQGIANFKTRPLERDEVLLKCPEVANAAAKRYKGGGQVENKEILSKRIYAGQKVTGVLEYFGCLDGDRLVSYCESIFKRMRYGGPPSDMTRNI